MKKIIAAAFISIALISCKKETQTVTKVDPKTGKTITVEVPVNDSVKTADEPVANAAIRDSSGIFKQSFKLVKGESYPLTTMQKDVQTMTAPDGKSQSGSSETTDQMTFTVNNFENGIYDITINLLGKRSAQSANGKSITIDTKSPEPKEDQLKMMWKVNKALVGNKLNLKMNETGKVTSITGFEPIYAKVTASAGTLIKDAKQKAEFAKSFKGSFNEKVLKDQFTKNLVLIPAKGVKIGEKWSQSENATPDGKLKLTTTYTLKSVDNGVATISVSGGIPAKSDSNSQNGMTRSMTSELSQNGTITLDQKTGWIKNQNIAVKTSQSETISDGKQKQTMKSVSNSTVVVNP